MKSCNSGSKSVWVTLCFALWLSLTASAVNQKETCASSASAKPPLGYIAITDPGKKESPFAAALRHRGLLPIFVRSDQFPDPIDWGVLDLFENFDIGVRSHLQSGRFEEALAGLRMVRELEKLPLTHVVAESGSGAFFAERLSAALRLPGHSPAMVNAVNVPAEMFSRLKKYFKQVKSEVRLMPLTFADKPAKVREWIREEFGSWHGTDGLVVTTAVPYSGAPSLYVRNDRELEAAMNYVVGSDTPMGYANHRALVMPYIAGEEYSVNGAILREGRKSYVRFTSVVHHVRPDRTDSGNETLLSAHEVPAGLLKAQKEVLEGLEYTQGAFHGQFKIARSGEIYFIKHDSGFHGHGLTDLIDSCTTYGQVQAAADVFGDPHAFKERAGETYETNYRGVVLSIEVPRTERALRANHSPLNLIEEKLRAANHLYRIDRYAKHGDRLEPSNGRLTVMARIEIRVPMTDLRREQILSEYLRWIQQLETEGKFFIR